MTRFILRRLFEAAPLLLAVIVVNFLIIHLAPGDPVQALVGDFPAPPEYVQHIREQFGLDQPLWKQLVSYLMQVLRGDLGYSFANRRPVVDLLVERLANTLILTVTALVFATLIGITLGVSAARKPRSWRDNLVTTASLLGFSIPVFWLRADSDSPVRGSAWVAPSAGNDVCARKLSRAVICSRPREPPHSPCVGAEPTLPRVDGAADARQR